jgi:lantibiotic modifying enzyme
MLQQVNCLLPRLNIPSWIKGAVPVLGKASYGKFKADEWRTLFLIQLPLILVKIWGGPHCAHVSLLQNFSHLVAAVYLALKRSMTEARISMYLHHIEQYLSSSRIMFPNCPLAPNHHLSMHIGKLLSNLGPVQAWWLFPMERLMGEILQSTHNNRIETIFSFEGGTSLTNDLA